MKMTKQEYAAYAEKRSPRSPTAKNTALAFCFGGAVCLLGELLTELYGMLGVSETDSGTLATVSLVAFSALLTGLKIYDRIAKHVGAGIVVPITGFANSVVSPAMEFRSEGLVLGLSAKMFVVAGPVIVYGVTASVLYGLALLIFG